MSRWTYSPKRVLLQHDQLPPYGYAVDIKNNETGEMRRYHSPYTEWSDGSMFFWTDGNYGCDCNRGPAWHEAGGVSNTESYGYDTPCGDGALFTAVRAVLPDGTIIPIEKPDAAVVGRKCEVS